jgi:hypothetical protein
MPWEEVDRSWLAELLRKAADEDHPEALKALLQYFLASVRVKCIGGVFTPWVGRPGAPKKDETERVYLRWKELREPSFGRLAHDIYGADFTKANREEQNALRSRVRGAVRRYETHLSATQSQPN